jgi:ribose 5-phosphate isomerase B
MKLILGADHGGFQLKEEIKQWLTEKGYQINDVGANHLDPKDDYPDFAQKVANKIAQASYDQPAVGVLFCRSGGGMVIAANKIKGIRAVDVYDKQSAIHAKAHNNANVIAIGGDWLTVHQARVAIKVFLQTEFEKEPRHARRIKKIAQMET